MWRSLSLRQPRDSNRLVTTSLRVNRLPDKRTYVFSQRALQFCPVSSPVPTLTCSWLLVSGQRSLSRLLARSFCGRAGCRSFRDVLRPRRPAGFDSDLPETRKGREQLGW